jgi:glycerol uptake facilitator-like aquaporin
MNLRKAFLAELIGTAFLLAVVVGSGIMGERLANGDHAITLLANSLATGAGLMALIITFGVHSGAHFNPVVTLAEASLGRLAWRMVPMYFMAQIIGAFAGVAAAHVMFELPLFTASEHLRTGASQWFSEFVATFGLLAIILVYLIDIIREPGSDLGAGDDQYFFRHLPSPCASVYRGAISWIVRRLIVI